MYLVQTYSLNRRGNVKSDVSFTTGTLKERKDMLINRILVKCNKYTTQIVLIKYTTFSIIKTILII